MVELVKQHLSQLNELCRRYAVRRLELFGSGATGSFDPRRSDIDLLVLFAPSSAMNRADQYLDLLEELQQLFQRKIDLVDVTAARNPYFLAEALKSRVMLYAA